MNDDTLKAAIEYLSAVEVAPGRFAYRYCGGESTYAIVPLSEIQRFEQLSHVTVPHVLYDFARGFDIWSQGLGDLRVMMPAWWRPDHRYIVRYDSPDVFGHIIKWPFMSAKAARQFHSGGSIVTADLDTGEEIVSNEW